MRSISKNRGARPTFNTLLFGPRLDESPKPHANRNWRLAPSNLDSFLEGKNHTAVPWWGAAGKCKTNRRKITQNEVYWC